jgi:hypothetical protein
MNPGELATLTHRQARGFFGPSRMTDPLREGPLSPDIGPRILGDPKCRLRLIWLGKRIEPNYRDADVVLTFWCPCCNVLVELRRGRCCESPFTQCSIPLSCRRVWNPPLPPPF